MGWDGELTGQLTQLDFDTLVTGRFPHVLRGTADLRLERAKLMGGRITEAAGALTRHRRRDQHFATDGRGRSLAPGSWQAAAVVGHDQSLRPPGPGFHHRIQGATLLGRCGPTEALLVRNGEALWKQPLEQPQPVVALVRALVPANEVQVPAAGETDLLLRYLPLAADQAAARSRWHARDSASPASRPLAIGRRQTTGLPSDRAAPWRAS